MCYTATTIAVTSIKHERPEFIRISNSDKCSKCFPFYFQIGGGSTWGCPQDFDKNLFESIKFCQTKLLEFTVYRLRDQWDIYSNNNSTFYCKDL